MNSFTQSTGFGAHTAARLKDKLRFKLDPAVEKGIADLQRQHESGMGRLNKLAEQRVRALVSEQHDHAEKLVRSGKIDDLVGHPMLGRDGLRDALAAERQALKVSLRRISGDAVVLVLPELRRFIAEARTFTTKLADEELRLAESLDIGYEASPTVAALHAYCQRAEDSLPDPNTVNLRAPVKLLPWVD